jgi:hypothetical protein
MTPKLIQEWHSKNEKSITEHSKRFKAWWKCGVCGHEWQATIYNRMDRGSNCPNCWKISKRGSKNSRWTGYGEISGRQWLTIKREALRKKLSLDVTIQQAWEVFLSQDQRCIFTGKELAVVDAALDRKDTSKGYILSNLQWIDKKLQHVKTRFTDAEFIAICQKVAAYQVEKLGIPSFKQWATKKTA